MIKAPNERGEAKVSFLPPFDVYPEQIAKIFRVEEIAPMTVV